MSSITRGRRAMLAFALSVAVALLAGAVSVAFGGMLAHAQAGASALVAPQPDRPAGEKSTSGA